jgi:predicted secreted protein
MKRTVSFLIFISVLSFMFLNAQWIKTYGGSGDDHALKLQQTSDGGYIVAGQTRSFEGSEFDLRILKLDLNGSIEWENTYTKFDSNNILSIQQKSNGGFIVAGHTIPTHPSQLTCFWILNLDQVGNIDLQGSFRWYFETFIRSIQQTSDEGYILAGYAQSVGEGGEDIWVLKLSSSGDVEWQRTYGGNSLDRAFFIQQTGDGGYVVAGYTRSFGAGEGDIWVLKLSSSGDVEWQRTYGGSSDDGASFIQQTGDGGYVVAGYTRSFGAGERDIWVLKLSSSGDVEWQRAYGGIDEDNVFSISQTPEGGYVAGSNTLSFGAGEEDIWVLKLSSSGDVEWQKTYGAYFDEEASFIQQSTDGSYVIAGSTFSFGNGGEDFCILKLAQDGNIEMPCRFINESNAGVLNTDVNPENTDVAAVDPELYVDMDDLFFYEEVTDSIDFELCSENPILAILSASGGTTSPMCGTYVYELGTEISITAIPESNYRFQEWSGDAIEQNNPLKIILDSDKSVKANFIRQYTLTVAAGQGGTTDPEPGTYTEDSGKEITITAIPDQGYGFSKWSGLFGTSNPIKIILNSDKSIEANFVRVSGDGDYDNIFRFKCFIATAVYGSALHPYVKVLRDFRDKYLMSSKIGRKCVDLYYRYSPQIAGFISKHKSLRVMAQLYLLPFVAFSFSMVHFGPIPTIAAIFFIFSLQVFFILLLQNRFDRSETQIS